MKPHIYKAGRVWWCYTKEYMRAYGKGNTPKEAYLDWLTE